MAKKNDWIWWVGGIAVAALVGVFVAKDPICAMTQQEIPFLCYDPGTVDKLKSCDASCPPGDEACFDACLGGS